MAANRILFNTNVNRNVVWATTGKFRGPKPLRYTKVDIEQERLQLIKRVLTWALIIPLSIFVIPWFLLTLADMLII